MKTARVAFAVCVAAAMFVAGYATRAHSTDNAFVSGGKGLVYTCPMHPDYHANHAGDCPICGMRLQEAADRETDRNATGTTGAAGAVAVSATQRQMIGLRTEVVLASSTSSVLRLPGRVAPDDSRLYRLIAATDGWVRELGSNPAGTLVRQNEALASYFVRDLVTAEQNYLYAYQTAAAQTNQANVAPQRASPALNLRLALDALRSLGMTDTEVERLQQKGTPSSDLHLYAPVDGVVLSRGISPGQRFDKGSELYRIADLRRVWVLADVFERDRDSIRPGVVATVRCGGKEYRARACDLLPQFDAQSRVLKARFELDNPGLALRPDMFVEVELGQNTASALTVPADAVIDSGLRKTIYVQRGIGSFEPRTVETGTRAGDRVEIKAGLSGGESVVVAGTFLVDSESRLRSPTGVPVSHHAGTDDPVCGMEVAANSPGVVKTDYRGITYYFCSDTCKKAFDNKPGRYMSRRSS